MDRRRVTRRTQPTMIDEQRHARAQADAVAGTHTRRLRNVTTPSDRAHPVEEVRVEHGGVYVLAHVPRQGGEIHVAADLSRLDRAAKEVRTLLPDRYRSRVTAALVIPTEPTHTDRVDVVASVGGVLVLDAASLAHAVRYAAPALSTSEVSAVEGLLRRRLEPANRPAATRQPRWPHLLHLSHFSRLRSRHVVDAA